MLQALYRKFSNSNITLQDFSFYCCNWKCFVKYQQWVPYELHRPHSLSTTWHILLPSIFSRKPNYFCSLLFHFYMSILNASSNHLGFYQLVCNHLFSFHQSMLFLSDTLIILYMFCLVILSSTDSFIFIVLSLFTSCTLLHSALYFFSAFSANFLASVAAWV